MIRFSELIEDESKDDEVGLNKLVELYFEEDDESLTYKVVTSIRGSSIDGRISIESPLGKAIMSKKVGDRCKVVVNEQIEYYVEVKSITQDDEDDEIRSF